MSWNNIANQNIFTRFDKLFNGRGRISKGMDTGQRRICDGIKRKWRKTKGGRWGNEGIRAGGKYCLLTNGCPDPFIRHRGQALNYCDRQGLSKARKFIEEWSNELPFLVIVLFHHWIPEEIFRSVRRTRIVLGYQATVV